MTTAYTPILQLALPVTGELNGTWGDVVNNNITSMVEQAIAGLATINTWTTQSHTLTTANGTTDEARCAVLECSGAPGGAATVVCPAFSKVYIIKNSVTGGYAVTLKTSAGSGISVPNGSTALLYCDGTNVVSGSTYMATVVTTSITDSGLTSGRVTYAGAGGLLSDSASLTWNGSTLAVTGALTATADSAFTSTGAVQLPVGTTGQQPTGASGKIRYNSTTSSFEGYSGGAWSAIGGGSALSNDTASTSNLYPLFASATSGTPTTIYTSNARLLYKPSTGELSATAHVSSNGITVNSSIVAADYTIGTNFNAVSAGPITINSGITVTVASGSVWAVV